MKFPSVEIEKRHRDEHTETLIKSLLDEEKVSKKQKKGPTPADVGARPAVQAQRGKTFAEIESEEGGPIKESLVGMAHTKRALDRKKREVEVGDTDVVTNTELYEKDTLDVEQEEGITFEPFNLKQEREEGYFDEEGNYVLRKQAGEEGEDEKDAWLNSDEAKVVSDKVRRKIEEQRARDEEAARRGPLTERQIAQRKADMAAMMRPGETVTRALKRLGSSAGAGGGGGGTASAAGLQHRAMGKRERARLLAQQQQQGTDASAMADAAGESISREQFSHMTELADELLAEGELEIYEATQEELLRSARMWLPQLAAAAAALPPAAPTSDGVGSAAANAAAKDDDGDDDMFADDDDEKEGMAVKGAAAAVKPPAAVDHDQDMFADDDDDDDDHEEEGTGTGREGQEEEEVAAAAVGVIAATASRKAAGVRSGGLDMGSGAQGSGAAWLGAAAFEEQTRAAKDGKGEVVDYSSWPVKELKRLLQERGVDPSGFVEKADLVAKVKEIADAAGTSGNTRDGAGGGGVSAFIAPPGYVFDPSSGYFYSEDAGMYYDTRTGGYCQASTGQWFYLDAGSGAFVEWKQ